MKKLKLCALMLGASMAAYAQNTTEYAFEDLRLSQTELRGTSRFMSMAGAFGALGGDISALNQNPGGIGVYRSSDLGLTLSLDANRASSSTVTKNETKFNVNNFGYVGAVKLNSTTMPNFNFGFSYSRLNSYDRRYRGVVYDLPTSLTNYIADKAMSQQAVVSDFNSYNSPAQWNQILAYNNYLILPTNNEGTRFAGLGFNGVHGDGEYEMIERGHTDEFSLNIGGNIKNTVYWGIGVGVIDLLNEYSQYYGESLEGTEVYNRPDDATATLVDGNVDFGLVNGQRTTGTGYNFKFGVIVKPVNEFRLGLAFHTPTYYDIKSRYFTALSAQFAPMNSDVYSLNDETPEEVIDYKVRTPWRMVASMAGVIGTKGIISADYEYVANDNIRVEDNVGELDYTTEDIKNYLQPSHIIRLGGEYRINPSWSLRAGYSYQTSSTKDEVQDDQVDVYVSGSSAAYTYDRSTQNITCGFGYHYKNVYFDMAYVHKYAQNNYHLFPGINDLPTVKDKVNFHNNRISATIGFRF